MRLGGERARKGAREGAENGKRGEKRARGRERSRSRRTVPGEALLPGPGHFAVRAAHCLRKAICVSSPTEEFYQPL